ncbi:MAG: hypothetical protein R2710_12705 [Acidimicrobiales bacterium]
MRIGTRGVGFEVAGPDVLADRLVDESARVTWEGSSGGSKAMVQSMPTPTARSAACRRWRPDGAAPGPPGGGRQPEDRRQQDRDRNEVATEGQGDVNRSARRGRRRRSSSMRWRRSADVAAVDGTAAVEPADHPAGVFDDRDGAGDVVGLEQVLDHEITEA